MNSIPSSLFSYKYFSIGRFSFLWNGGYIRRISHDHQAVIIMGIYPALRDPDWGTVPSEVMDTSIVDTGRQVTISEHLRFGRDEIIFDATVTCIFDAEGNVQYDFQGESLKEFRKNRLGLNVLLPVKPNRGKSCQVLHTSGKKSDGIFPDQISPHQPIMNIKKIMWGDNDEFEMTFSGDVFEMEDQRNWTDASYKIYSTPLALPYPVKVKDGEQFKQSVQVKLKSRSAGNSLPESLSLLNNPGRLPQIGLRSVHGTPLLEKEEVEALRNLAPDYLYHSCDFSDKSWRIQLIQTIRNSSLLNIGLHLAVLIPAKGEPAYLKEFNEVLSDHASRFHSIEPFCRSRYTTGGDQVNNFIESIRRIFPEIKIGGGSYAHYAELNRASNLYENLDYICFSASPQAHAFDDLTLIENLKGIEYASKDASEKFILPVHVGPVTLRQRMNFVATSDQDQDVFSSLPENVDVRQAKIFGALWTLGCINALMRAGIKAVSLYETMGLSGVMQSKRPQKGYGFIPEIPLMKFPVYYALSELLRFRGNDFCPVNNSVDFLMDGFSIENKELWIWNYRNFSTIPEHLEDLLKKYRTKHTFSFEKNTWEQEPFSNVLQATSLYRYS